MLATETTSNQVRMCATVESAVHVIEISFHSYRGMSGFYLLGEAGGKLPPLTTQLPPKWFASDSTYNIILAFISSIIPVLITQELKFSLLKLSQVIKCFSFRVSCRRDHIPTPYSYIVNDGFPSKF